MGKSKLTVTERFWSKVDKSPGHGPNGECWIWTASTFDNGYGQLKVRGKNRKAHRLAYEIQAGPIPEGLSVCHHCDNRPCIRLDHLFLGTPKENEQDKIAKGRRLSTTISLRKVGLEGTSWCIDCRSFLESSNFHQEKQHWNGLSKRCKGCTKIRDRKRYIKNKGKLNAK
jgi:hypothetical protein